MKSETEIRELFDHMDRMLDRISDLSNTSVSTGRGVSVDTAMTLTNAFNLLQASMPLLVWVLNAEEDMQDKYGDIPEGRCTVATFLQKGEQYISNAYKEMESSNARSAKKRR